MSRGDLILQWVSCYRELRTARVRAAAERLCAPPVVIARDDPRMAAYLRAARWLMQNLLRLGHIEELNATRLRTVPPTVVVGAGGKNTLIGARSAEVRKKLSTLSGVGVLSVSHQSSAPAAWYVTGAEDAVASAATSLGLTLVHDRSSELLSSLPCFFDILSIAPHDTIPEKTERWNPDAPVARRRWSRTRAGAHTPGLYRTIRKPHEWYLCAREGEPAIRLDTPERRVAAPWVLRRRTVRIEYSQRDRVMSIPAIGFGLPLLVDRALILASGRLPEWASRKWNYFDIEPERADQAARIIGIPFEVTT